MKNNDKINIILKFGIYFQHCTNVYPGRNGEPGKSGGQVNMQLFQFLS